MFDMYKDKYELNVLVNGKPIREYFHNNKFFIEAKNGTEYSLKLKNHSHKKIMAVISVDGVEVLKGGKASEAESGYIVNPYSSINIQGYRIDDNNVATFKFSDGKTSYATQVEQKFNEEKLEQVKKGEIAPAKNNGIIGIRIWEEKEPLVIPEWKQEQIKINKKNFYNHGSPSGFTITSFNNISGATSNLFQWSGALMCSGASIHSFGTGNSILYNNCSASINYCSSINNDSYESVSSNCSLSQDEMVMSRDILDTCAFGQLKSLENYSPNFELGTTWGKQQEDKVVKIKFEKAESYIDLECFYLTRPELIKMGVDLDNTKKIFISGFPKAFEEEEYCKQPKNWRKE